MLIKGTNLQPSTKREVLSAFMYRATRENILARPRSLRPFNTKVQHYNLCWTTDERWLEQHAFYVNKDGTLARNRNHCEPAFLAEEDKQ